LVVKSVFYLPKSQKKTPSEFCQLGELKIKVHLPINSSPWGSVDPDKVTAAEQAQDL
jgi:hypothetical protein